MIQVQDQQSDEIGELILNNAPSSGTAYIIMSEWYNRGNYDAVIRAGRDMLNLYPDDLRLRRLACLAYSALDFDEETSAETGEIMDRLGELADVFLLRAKIFQRSDRIREALDALGTYLALRPGDPAGIDLLEKLQPADPDKTHPAGDETDAIPAVASATIAELYLSQGLVGDAVKTYRLVVAANPGDENARRRLDELETRSGTHTEDRKPAGKLPPANGYREVLEQWRSRCREIFDTASPTG